MAVQKRAREDEASTARPAKKAKKTAHPPAVVEKPAATNGSEAKPGKTDKPKPAEPSTKTATTAGVKRRSVLVADEIDFPRGGGTTLTPLEYKEVQAEAAREVKEELFKESGAKKRKVSSRRDAKAHAEVKKAEMTGIRVEHLNYKRLQVGTKLLCRIGAIHPLHLVLSLPNQLAGYVPITHISTQLTAALEKDESSSISSIKDEDEDAEDEDDEEEEKEDSRPPDLASMFTVGQYVRASVTTIRSAGARSAGALDLGKPRNDQEAMSRRVELSLVPGVVNEGVVPKDVVAGFTLSGAIKSVEDHGYLVNLGLSTLSAFLPFDNVPQATSARLKVGHLLSCTVLAVSENGRVCTVTAKREAANEVISEVSSVTSVLPGMLVRGLITAAVPAGLNLQILGFFDGTIDLAHLPNDVSTYKLGSKIKVRVLWDMPGSSPPKFALSALPHIVSLSAPRIGGKKGGEDLQEKYTFGAIVYGVKVVHVDAEWGLTCELPDGAKAFIHISHISDDRIPALSSGSGAWKVGTVHTSRVLGFYALDGLLQLSLKPSVLERKYLQTGDLQVGQVIKGTVQRLTDVGLFVDVGGNVNGRVRPEHYADILLKHPEKRFKPGMAVKCRILAINAEHNKLSLTLKKSLVNSELPILASFEDAKPDLVVDAVVFKLLSTGVLVDFYGGLKGFVSLKEASDEYVKSAEDMFTVGQSLKVKILSTSAADGHILASVRQALSSYEPPKDELAAITIGDTVEGEIKEVQAVNIVLSLQPGGQTALMSLANLAHRRHQKVEELRGALSAGVVLSDLIVVSKNTDKKLVIVAARPSTRPAQAVSGGVSFKNIKVGQILPGRVVGEHGPAGVSVRLSQNVTGRLHPLDSTDNLDDGVQLPAIEAIVKVAVVGFSGNARTVDLSTRQSKLNPDAKAPVADREINSIGDLKVGEEVRGLVKNISDYGLYVALGRTVTARVQIKELFDEYVKEWKPNFALNQVVKGKIIQIDPESKRVEMSLRSGAVPVKTPRTSKPSESLKGWDVFSEGEKVSGHVTGIAEFGVFIRINESNVGGLCHHSELSDAKEGDVRAALKGFRIGDSVKAVILTLDKDKRKVSFGLKPSYFTTEDYEMDDGTPNAEALEGEAEVDEEMADVEGDEVDDVAGDVAVEDEDVGSDESEDDIIVVNDAPLPRKANGNAEATASNGLSKDASSVPTLQLSGGFQWSAAPDDEDEDGNDAVSEEESEGSATAAKPKKKRRGPRIEEDLTAVMQERAPESVADYERLLLGSPNSSFLWIQFMSFYMQLSELDKAREVARRALKVINFREEQEKLNVWIALLNLENTVGTEETLESVFQEATRANDSKTMHLRMAAIFDESEKPEKAEDIYKRAAKKFGQSSKVWVLSGRHYLTLGKMDEARELLPRSLKSLEKRKHIKTILKFAQLEYELGDPERGKTLLEAIVDSHPKRLDLWFVYVDMEAKQGDLQAARKLFERMLAMSLNTFKAKSCFKKWLELEKRIGDEAGEEVVKSRAVEWTQRNSA